MVRMRQTLGIAIIAGSLLGFTWIASAQGTVNDSSVKKWISAGIEGKTCAIAGKAEYDLTLADPPEKLQRAFYFLKHTCRDNGDSKDLDLAAAENYVFIRWVASASGDTGYADFPDYYYTVKSALSLVNLQNLIKTSTKPVSDPNPNVKRWGVAGYNDGIRDYEKRMSQKATRKTDSILTALDFLARQYYAQH